ncbi:MAG TPA: DNA polymerase III subunit beta [Candidatus Saccharibacteria bacterium]|nr:DNA polymerase III subunit beta [Candidatus Saccharibacteria bacterium]
MKVTVTQENLSKALGVVSRVASNRTSLPVLNNILLRTESNRLLLAATNLEVAITEHIGAKVTSEGAITIPARLLSEFIANLPKGNVELKVDGTKLHISADKYISTINGMPADEFPELPQIENAYTLSLPTSLLKQAISQTVLTASSDDTRPVLTGVLCHVHNGELYLAATDGYRLSERRLVRNSDDIKALIPAATLSDVARVVPEDCDEVTILIDDSQVRFRMNDIEVTSRLIEGNFPDYRQLIPKETEIHATLSRSEFVRVTKVASLFARESGGSVTVATESEGQVVSIHSIASQLGENTSEAAAEVDQSGSVTLNSRYLIEALGCFDKETIKFGFSGKLAPCVITEVDGSGDYQHIIMPLRS